MKRIAFISCVVLFACILCSVSVAMAEETCSHRRWCDEEVCFLCKQPYTGNTIEHVDQDTMDYDEDYHWNYCTSCDTKYNVWQHEGICTDLTKCNVCGVPCTELSSWWHAIGNITSISIDEKKHLITCNGCNESWAEAHWRMCDQEVCIDCGESYKGNNITGHEFTGTYSYDEEKHWLTCNICGKKVIEKHFRNCDSSVCKYCGAEYTGNVKSHGETKTIYSEKGHEDICLLCNETISSFSHIKLCDSNSTICETEECGVKLTEGNYELVHNLDNIYLAEYNDQYHWVECPACNGYAIYDRHDYTAIMESPCWCGAEYTLAITKQPTSVTVAEGKTAKVTVESIGDEDRKYTWYLKKVGETKFTKSAQTTPTYSITMTEARNGNQLYCVVSDIFGNSVKSNTVTISMIPKFSIVKQPVSVAVGAGLTAKTTVTAEGEGLTYLWYYKKAGGANFIKSAQTKATYSIAMTEARNGYQIYCVITDENGNTVTSDTVTLSMATPLAITKQPKTVTVAKGAIAKTTVTAEGDGLTYLWYYKKPSGTSFIKSAQTTKTYSTTMTDARNGYKVYCVITDKYGNTVKTNTVTLKMQTPLAITTQPKTITVAKGATAKTTVTATGDGLTYLWYYKKANGTSFIKSAQTTKTYSTTMTDARNGYKVYCVITDKYGNTVKTNTVTLKMQTPLAITTQPKTVTVAKGATAKTTVTATGDGLTYLWYYKKAGGSSFIKSAQTTKTYSTTMTDARNGYQLYCVITDKYGKSIKTNTVTLKMK